MAAENHYSDMVANVVLSGISYFTRVVFGGDKLTRWQLVAFFACCIGWVWIVSLLNVNRAIGAGLAMTGGLVIPSLIKAIISGSKSAEPKVAKTVQHNIENISEKVDDIADVLTHNKDDKK